MRALIKLWADLMLNDCQKRALDAPVKYARNCWRRIDDGKSKAFNKHRKN